MLHLIAMNEEQFRTFATHSSSGYAQDIEQTYLLPKDLAQRQALEIYNELLPDGLDTPEHYLFSLRSRTGEDVGVLWFGINSDHGSTTLFIYDIEIHPHAQRCGHGKKALEHVESWARAHGIRRIELNVFAHNKAGLALYSAYGLEPHEITMSKRLD